MNKTGSDLVQNWKNRFYLSAMTVFEQAWATVTRLCDCYNKTKLKKVCLLKNSGIFPLKTEIGLRRNILLSKLIGSQKQISLRIGAQENIKNNK